MRQSRKLTRLDFATFFLEWKHLSNFLPKPWFVQLQCWLVGHHVVSCMKVDWQYCGRCGKLFIGGLMKRGAYTGHRVRRPMIEVNCPTCEVTIDTEARTWIDCPACGARFNRHTGLTAADKVHLEE